MRNRTLFTIAAGTLAGAAFVAAGSQGVLAASGDDPATAPIPTYDYADPAKSFVVDLDFGISSASVVDAVVGPDRSVSHLGDPPLLKLVLSDEDDNVLERVDAWDPRWTFVETGGVGERMEVRAGRGLLTVPFDSDSGSMLVRDQVAGTDLVTVDLTGAVHEFCVAHPTDPECVEADLAITASSATGTPLSVVGAAVPVSVSAVVANLGPDGPVDADVTQTAAAGAGLSVTPASSSDDVDALAVGTPRTVTHQYAVTCTTPGSHSVVFTTTVAPEKAKVVDAVPGNNSRSATYTVDCAVPVVLNVEPGSLKNPVQLDMGLVPMAVLSTAAGEYGLPLAFDARKIQVSTVRIGQRTALVASNTGAPEAHGKLHLEDSYELDEVTRDGDLDALLHGRDKLIPLTTGITEICVRGRFGPGAGTSFLGCDAVKLVP
jgi:hypothetical protein